MHKILLYIGIIALHFLMVYLVHMTGSKFYNNRIYHNKTNPKVFDIGEKYLLDLHNIKWVRYLVDFIAALSPLIFGITVALEHARFMIIILAIRHIFTLVTILPKHKKCDDSRFGIREVFVGHCYDKIFSGHFSSLFLLCLILLKQGIVSIPLVTVVLFIYGSLLICIRYHYTVDILVAFVVTLLVFQNNWKLRLF
jgi:hypothetical protein